MHIARRRARSSRQNILSKNAVPASFAQNVLVELFGAFFLGKPRILNLFQEGGDGDPDPRTPAAYGSDSDP